MYFRSKMVKRVGCKYQGISKALRLRTEITSCSFSFAKYLKHPYLLGRQIIPSHQQKLVLVVEKIISENRFSGLIHFYTLYTCQLRQNIMFENACTWVHKPPCISYMYLILTLTMILIF
jgi:hypothetical protein